MLDHLETIGGFVRDVGTGLLGIASAIVAIAGLVERKKTNKTGKSHKKKKRNRKK